MQRPLSSEVSRPFSKGFILDKEKLKALRELLASQIAGTIEPTHQFTERYEVRVRNGAIRQRSTLKEVFDNEPNGKEQTIKGLKITMESANQPIAQNLAGNVNPLPTPPNIPEKRAIVFQLSDVHNLPNPPIYYDIVGTSDSWVTSTDVNLASSIDGFKTFSFDLLFKKFIPQGSTGLALIVLLVISLILLQVNMGPFPLPSFIHSPMNLILFDLALVLILYLLVQALLYFFPSYNFCWGSYETSFNTRRKIGIGFFTLVVLATAVAIFANYLTYAFHVTP